MSKSRRIVIDNFHPRRNIAGKLSQRILGVQCLHRATRDFSIMNVTEWVRSQTWSRFWEDCLEHRGAAHLMGVEETTCRKEVSISNETLVRPLNMSTCLFKCFAFQDFYPLRQCVRSFMTLTTNTRSYQSSQLIRVCCISQLDVIMAFSDRHRIMIVNYKRLSR